MSNRARHILFLQGMPSPFFLRLAQALRDRGCRVSRINLCLGDRLFWRGEGAIDFREHPDQWPDFIRRYLLQERVQDLVLIGEKRRYHREAVEIAQGLGIRVWITDFGYLRPDWITWDRDGLNGLSSIPRDPEKIRTLGAGLPALEEAPLYRDSWWRMAVGDLSYNFANLADKFWYRHYQRSDERPHPLIYTPASAKRLLSNRLRLRYCRLRASAWMEHGTPFFLFPLQLDFDYQIQAYSPYRSMGHAISQVLRSFARHAPKDHRLIVKEHPWDPAVKDWHRFTRHLAKRLGIADRVLYLRGGSLDIMIRQAEGVVVVNSTSGLRALQHGKPVCCLGTAVYDVPGLVHPGGLVDFWVQPQAPDSELLQAFLRLLADRIQIRGVFFAEPGLTAAVNAACARLLAEPALSAPHLSVATESDKAPATNADAPGVFSIRPVLPGTALGCRDYAAGSGIGDSE
jgi:capsular polysaccharide export protein